MVLDLIRQVRDRGLPVILISHNMPQVFEVADRDPHPATRQARRRGRSRATSRCRRRRDHDRRAVTGCLNVLASGVITASLHRANPQQASAVLSSILRRRQRGIVRLAQHRTVAAPVQQSASRRDAWLATDGCFLLPLLLARQTWSRGPL